MHHLTRASRHCQNREEGSNNESVYSLPSFQFVGCTTQSRYSHCDHSGALLLDIDSEPKNSEETHAANQIHALFTYNSPIGSEGLLVLSPGRGLFTSKFAGLTSSPSCSCLNGDSGWENCNHHIMIFNHRKLANCLKTNCFLYFVIII